MAQVTIHKDPNVEVVVIDGLPPVDQTALVASLTAERDAAIAERDVAVAARDAVQAKLDALNTGIDQLQGQA